MLVGTNSVVEGHCSIGSNVSIQSNVYIPKNTTVEDYVFIGPCVCFTNDRYPIRTDYKLKGPKIRRGASIEQTPLSYRMWRLVKVQWLLPVQS